MKKLFSMLTVIFIFSLIVHSQQSSDALVLKAWENWVSKDPQTIEFKKISEGEYQLNTKKNSFHGILKAKRFIYEEVDDSQYNQRVMIIFEYSINNITYSSQYCLLFDAEQRKWITTDERVKILAEKVRKNKISQNMVIYGSILMVIILIIVGIITTRHAKRSANENK